MKRLTILIMYIIAIFIFGCSSEKKENMHDIHEHNMKNEKVASPLIREGVIDIVSIDENKDEHLYECPMDWNVLSDTEGDCPVCGMNLKQFEIEKVKENLTKYGYKFKE